MIFHLVTPEGRAAALEYADRLADKTHAARIRQIVARAAACGDWHDRLELAQALNDDAPLPEEIAARAAEIRVTWQIADRQEKGTNLMSKIEWPARGRRDETAVARRRILTSLCGRYRIVENTYKLSGMPRRVHALVAIDGAWEIIFQHREIGPAMQACASHSRVLATVAAG